MKIDIERTIIRLFDANVSERAKRVFFEILNLEIRRDMLWDNGFHDYAGWSSDWNPQIRELEKAGILTVRSDELDQLAVKLSTD
jgi:hypothetical protein